MRLLLSIAVTALYSGVAASQQAADVYILRSKQQQQSSTDTPRLPKEVARHILVQRTSRYGYGPDLGDVPDTMDTPTALAYISSYGKSPAPLFAREQARDPAQLVMIVEGSTEEHASVLKGALAESKRHAAFAVSDPPSSAGNRHLVSHMEALGVWSVSQCEMAAAINPFDNNCWRGSASVVKYDVAKNPDVIANLVANLGRLEKFVADGDLEATLVLMPEASRTSRTTSWFAASASKDLKRRNGESATQGMARRAPGKKATSTGRSTARVPQCFASQGSCVTATGNCSGHGTCASRHGDKASAAAAAAAPCFRCACQATVVTEGGAKGKGRKTEHWGGGMCEKKDVSVPFWLLVGFTIAMVGAISFCIGLLFGVGEEPLPGVIGAGVSRTAK